MIFIAAQVFGMMVAGYCRCKPLSLTGAMLLIHHIAPSSKLRVSLVAWGISACGLLSGCNRGPAAVQVPHVDPAEASHQALELYDANKDGKLSKQELTACPAVLGKLAVYDTDRDGAVSAAEIEAHLTELRSNRVGVTMLGIRVNRDGRPLSGAEVKLVPEPFLGEEVKPAYGITNPGGDALMDIRDEDSPASEAGLRGVHYGTYKVEVTHPTIKIPAKYNTATTLGYETGAWEPWLPYRPP